MATFARNCSVKMTLRLFQSLSLVTTMVPRFLRNFKRSLQIKKSITNAPCVLQFAEQPKIVIFQSTSQISFKCCISVQCHQTLFPYTFLAQTLYTLFKRIPLNCKFLRFSSARVQICQIPHVNFELTSQFLLKFCIILHCYDTKLPCKC